MKIYKWKLTWWEPFKQTALFNLKKDAHDFQIKNGIRIAQYQKGKFFQTTQPVVQS